MVARRADKQLQSTLSLSLSLSLGLLWAGGRMAARWATAGPDLARGLGTGSQAGSEMGSPVGSWNFFCFFYRLRGGRSKEPAPAV